MNYINETQGIKFEDIKEGDIDFRLEHSEYERKMVTEREIDKAPDHLISVNTVFDDSESFLIFPTIFGINFFDLKKSKITKLLGHEESTERFMHIALYQGKALRNTCGQVGKGGVTSQQKEIDPTIFATSYKKRRFY